MKQCLYVYKLFNCAHFKTTGMVSNNVQSSVTCFFYSQNFICKFHLFCCMQATVRTGHGTTDWFEIGKAVRQGCILSPCFFNLYAEYIMRNAGLDEAQTEIKISGRNINNLRYADDTTLMAESEELKNLLMKVKEESEKVVVKLNIQKTKIMASGPITLWKIDGETVTDCILYFGGLQNHCRWWQHPWNKKTLTPGKKSYDQPRQHRCFWTVMLEKTLESPSDYKKIQPVHPKGNQSWVFIGRTAAEAETPVLWPLDAKSWLIWQDSDAGKDWRLEEKVTTEDEMVGWHHQLNGHEFGWTPKVGDGQGGLACCGPWGHKESHTTEWLNWTELNQYLFLLL